MKKLTAILLVFISALLSACHEEQQQNVPPPPIIDWNEAYEYTEQGTPAADTSQINGMIRKANARELRSPDSTIPIYRKALAISYKLNYHQGITEALLHIAHYYFTVKEDYQKARTYFSTALNYSKSPDTYNESFLPMSLMGIGVTFYREGVYDSANHFYFRSLEAITAKATPDTTLLIRAYLNIGAAMENLDKNYKRAFQYSRKAQQLAAKKRQKLQLITVNKNIGTLYTRIGETDSALDIYKQTLELAKRLKIRKEIQDMYNHVGYAYLKKGALSAGKAYIDSAVRVDSLLAADNWDVVTMQGNARYGSGDFLSAINYFKKALSITIRRGDNGFNRLQSYYRLAKLYDTIGDWKQAFQYLEVYTQLKDSVVNDDKLSSINEIEKKYELSEKEKLLALKDLKIVKAQADSRHKTTTIWIGALGILLLASILVSLGYRNANRLRKLDQQKELEVLQATMEGEEAERIRVGQELHDGISGLLSAVKMQLVILRLKRKDIAEEPNFITTVQLADEAADELRKTAHNLVPSSLMNNGLYKAIKGFCERVSTSSPLQINVIETGEAVRMSSAKELVVYRTIQELVNNIIKHSGATNGQVTLNWQEHILLVTVEDNGTGIDLSKNSDGIGIENIRKGLKRLNGTIQTQSIPGEGTYIYLTYEI